MRGKVLIVLCVIMVGFCRAQKPENKNEIFQDSSAKNYPVPPANKSMLFYLQRTHNTNTIVYALNFNSDSTLNENQPVIAYWIRYADGGGTAPLTSVQRSFAYGVSSQVFNKEKKWFVIHLVAYNKTDIYLMNSKTDKRYRAFTMINGKLAQLNRIFFKTDGGTFWNPNVVYVELKGKDISTGKSVTERFVPSK